MSVPLEMPSSEMDVETFNASDSDNKILTSSTSPKLCTNPMDQIDSSTVTSTEKLEVSNVENDKDIGVANEKVISMENVKCTTTTTSSTLTNTTDVGDAANVEILAAKEDDDDDNEAVVSTPIDEKIDAERNQPSSPTTSEIVYFDVKVVENDDDDDEKQVNEPLSDEIKTTETETIVKDSMKWLSNEKDDKQGILEKKDVIKEMSSNVDNGCELADKDPIEKDEQESNVKADSSLEIIDNLDDTDKSDEKMDEDVDDNDDEEEARRIAEAIDDADVDDDEDDVLGEPLTLDEEDAGEEEEEEEDEPEAQSSGNAILIDDEDDEDDEEDDEIDDEDVEDEEVIDENDVEDEEDGDMDNEEDDDIEEVIASDDDDDEDDEDEEDNSEPEEIRENIKINSRKGVDKRFGPKFKSKVKRPRNFFAHLKRRSIKWLTKKMHVMESDEMISTIPNDLTTPTVGCVSIGAGGGIKIKANDYRYNNIKDDEGIELIEDKDDQHHDDEYNADSDDDGGDEEEDETEKSPIKIDESDSKTNKKLNKNDSNLENSIIKNIILKQNDNKISSSDLTRSKSKTPPNLSSETLDLTSPPPPQQNSAKPPELKTNKEFKNDCNLVKKSAVVQEENNSSNNNNNNNNSCSDKKIKNEENVKIINLSNDDIEMIEDNQAVDLSQEKQQPAQQNTQPIELEIVDKDNKKNDKNNEIVATNQKSVKSPNNTTSSSSTVDCDKKLEIKKEEKPYVEPKPQDQQQQPLLKSSSSSSAASEKSGGDKNSNENSSKEDSGDETKKSVGGGGRSTQSGAIKRSSSPTANNQSLDYSNPSKKHCDETNSAAANIDQQAISNKTTNNNNNGDVAVLNEFMDKSQNDTPDELKKNLDQIQEEIQSLDEMLKIKEQEWNNMLHLKKLKEEIFERLTRRKRINDIKSILSIGSMDGYNEILANKLKQNNKLSQGGDGAQQPSIAVTTLKDYKMDKFSNSSVRPSSGVMQIRTNIKAADQVKDKLNSQRNQRQLLPKAPSMATSILQSAVNSQNKILNYTSINLNQQKKQSIHQQQQQQDYLNGHQANTAASLSSSAAMGRQGAIKDVQSIIADYRQKHPEEVPRRGRRLRPSFSMNEMSGGEGGREGNSRPSSADSSHSNSNLTSTPIQATSNAAATNISFKDVLVKYAKMSPSERQRLNTGSSATLLSSLNLSNSVANKAYPEVTLHPLNSTSLNSSAMHSSEPNTNVNSSLLHGILTKNTTRPVQQYNTFSPTLARLLTAPERITPQTSALFHQNSSNSAAGGGGGGGTNISSLTNPGVNLTKNHNEITITPVLNSNNSTTGGVSAAGTFLKRETGTEYSGSGNRIKTESASNLDDEADDSADRLVIDEGDASPGDQVNISGTAGQEFHENEVPECQGCKKREAQFVCAGCGNQWYCSRECQVRAWDEHSDICTG